MSDRNAFLSSGLSVVTCLPILLEAQIRSAVRKPHTLVCIKHWAELHLSIREKHTDVAVIDTAPEDTLAAERISQLLESFPSVAIVLYTTLRPSTARLVHVLTQRGLTEVIIQGFDDSPDRIALLLSEIPVRRLLPIVLGALRQELRQLPEQIRVHVESVFESPIVPKSVEEFAVKLGCSRQHVYELFEGAGLGSPRNFLIGARLLRAYTYLRDPGHSFAGITTKTGWVNPYALKKHLVSVFGVTIPVLRQTTNTEEVVRKVVQWIREQATEVNC